MFETRIEGLVQSIAGYALVANGVALATVAASVSGINELSLLLAVSSLAATQAKYFWGGIMASGVAYFGCLWAAYIRSEYEQDETTTKYLKWIRMISFYLTMAGIIAFSTGTYALISLLEIMGKPAS